jgi:type IV pilus assembly protein PilN
VENGRDRGSAGLVGMRLDINLATRPYQDAREFWRRWGTGLAALGLVSLALLVVTLWALYNAHTETRALDSVRKGIEAADSKLARAEAIMEQPQNRTLRERSSYLNSLFQQKAFSWTKVFEDLERVMPARLHVVSIKPDTSKANQLAINLVVAGDSRDKALDLVRKMEDSQHFRETRIDSESSLISPGVGEEVRFDITALYVGDSGFARQAAK